MRLRRFFLLLFIINFCFYSVYGEMDLKDIVIGKYRTVNSVILNEKRTLMIHLPRGYEKTDKKYPVLYLLDSDWKPEFYKTVSFLEDMAFKGKIPPMILVGIKNVDRGRDMFPFKIKGRNNFGGAVKFHDFIRKELFVFMKNNYRVQEYRILYGASNAGMFALHAF